MLGAGSEGSVGGAGAPLNIFLLFVRAQQNVDPDGLESRLADVAVRAAYGYMIAPQLEAMSTLR